MANRDSMAIRVALESDRQEAISLALRPLPPASRAALVASLTSQPPQPLGPLDALCVAADQDRIVAACWAQPTAGRAAVLWPPVWQHALPVDAKQVSVKLASAAVMLCDQAQTPLSQTLLEFEDALTVDVLGQIGFFKIADLDYLSRALRREDQDASANEQLVFEPFGQREEQRLIQLIDRTYIGTLDCPGLSGLRNLDDLLAAYRSTGRFDPKNWMFARQEERDVGVLLLTEHPESDQAEIIYMGLVPEARGKGLGAELVSRSIAQAARLGVDQIVVAADRANTPAIDLYNQFGFASWTSRSAYVRPLGGR